MTSDPMPGSGHGVQFAAADGRRSSQRGGKTIFADSVRAVDAPLADRIESSKDWRKAYIPHVARIVRSGASSGKDALRIASDGLDSVGRNLTFVDASGEVPLREAFRRPAGGPSFTDRVVTGEGAHPGALTVPYRGEQLTGDALLRRLERWEAAGTLEPSCVEALRRVVDNPDWLDLSDRRFALLGAASEMGPLEPLSAWGAHVIAVDLPRRALWQRIIEVGRKGSGKLTIPTAAGSDGSALDEGAGMDLLTDAPAVREWLGAVEGPMTVGNYVYADGATFVRLAAAVDCLIGSLLEERNDVSVAYLATPTDVFAVPEDTIQGTRERAKRSRVRKLTSSATGRRLYAESYRDVVTDGHGNRWGFCDALVPIQGPNYALAKSLQRWRAIMAKQEGAISSANVAPAANTRSVVKNKMLAAAYRGAPAYGIEIFEPETCRMLMAALLVHDLRHPASAANPRSTGTHPYELFAEAALHGGMWRSPYESRSVLPLAVLRGLARRKAS